MKTNAHTALILPIILRCALLIAPELGFPLTQAHSPVADSGRVQEHLAGLAHFGADPEGGGVNRVAFSDADVAGRAYVRHLMEAAGLEVRIDAAGNLIGRREGTDSKLPPIVVGSHTDSVPHGGNYDGDVGVMGGIEVAQQLRDRHVRLRHALEVVDFTDEEGGLVGSRAMAGELSPATLDLVNASGRSVRDGIRALGGDPDAVEHARRNPSSLAAYLELHIEQGGTLERTHTDIGVVEGIVGIHWWEAIITGVANHAGTTPMDQRHDALIAASELVLAVNAAATDLPGRQVATVGRIRAEPGAPNVIPGRVVLSIEVRDLDAARIEAVFEHIRARAGEIARARGTTIEFRDLEATAAPALTDRRIQRIIDNSAHALGLKTAAMPSGAGHDAQDIARIAPVGMIFIPSVGGISHSPREYSAPADITNGVNVLMRAVQAIDAGAINGVVPTQPGPAPATAEDQRMLPYLQPGRLIDIGGRRINLHCSGSGGPTTILMAGIFSWSVVWYKIQPVIAQKTRVCAFDRAGYGFSDPAPRPQILSDVVDDLHAALEAGHIPGPYVLVGHSLGGIEVRVYAQRWPKEIVGMVLVDSALAGQGLIDENQPGFDEVSGQESYAADMLHCAMLATHGPLEPSMPEYNDCTSVSALPSDTPAALKKAWPHFFTAYYFADKASLMSSVYTHRYDSVDHNHLGATPLVVLSAENSLGESHTPESARFTRAYSKVWNAMHESLAQLSSRGVHRIIMGSGHQIQLDKPQEVINAAQEVFRQLHTAE